MTKKKSRRNPPSTVIVPRRADRCEECEAALRWKTSTSNKPYAFSDYGFPLQVSGLSTAVCSRCGTVHAAIPNTDRFRTSVLEEILKKPGPLTASEIVFLRKTLGLTGGKFAGLVGVSREHVSHIEQGHAPNLGTAADRLARMMIASKIDPSLSFLKRLLNSLDENIGTRSRRKSVRHAGYRVSLTGRGPSATTKPDGRRAGKKRSGGSRAAHHRSTTARGRALRQRGQAR
jgi:DNA-binding transcriptional regulator YiaG